MPAAQRPRLEALAARLIPVAAIAAVLAPIAADRTLWKRDTLRYVYPIKMHLRERLLDAAASELEADRGDLELAEGAVRVKGAADRSITIADLAGSGTTFHGKGSGDVPEAPPGYDIGTGSLRVVPPYRSGYSVTVGSDYSTLVVGRLLDANGDPISLLAGTATELDVPGGKTLTVFTSRDGRFGAQGLRPGRWRIDMPASPAVSYTITIPKDSKSLVRIGDLKPQIVENK